MTRSYCCCFSVLVFWLLLLLLLLLSACLAVSLTTIFGRLLAQVHHHFCFFAICCCCVASKELFRVPHCFTTQRQSNFFFWIFGFFQVWNELELKIEWKVNRWVGFFKVIDGIWDDVKTSVTWFLNFKTAVKVFNFH